MPRYGCSRTEPIYILYIDGRYVAASPTRFVYAAGVCTPVEGIDALGVMHSINRTTLVGTVQPTDEYDLGDAYASLCVGL